VGDSLYSGTGFHDERRQSLVIAERAEVSGRLGGQSQHGGGSTSRRTGPGALLHQLEMVLATAVERDAIRDVFIFVEDSCELSIEPVASIAESSAASAPRTDEEALAAASAADLTARALEESRSTTGGRRNYDKADTASSLRVPAARLDQFVDLVASW